MRIGKGIDWGQLDLSTPEKLREFAFHLERAGREAVAEAIAAHKAAGNPIYFGDPADSGILVKELADGRRFRVDIADDGRETILAAVA